MAGENLPPYEVIPIDRVENYYPDGGYSYDCPALEISPSLIPWTEDGPNAHPRGRLKAYVRLGRCRMEAIAYEVYWADESGNLSPATSIECPNEFVTSLYGQDGTFPEHLSYKSLPEEAISEKERCPDCRINGPGWIKGEDDGTESVIEIDGRIYAVFMRPIGFY